MSAYDIQGVTALTIASAGTLSNVLTKKNLRNVKSLVINAPATLPETVTVYVSTKDGATANTATEFFALQSGGVDVIIAAGKAVVITIEGGPPFKGLMLKSGSAVGADRVFGISANDGL